MGDSRGGEGSNRQVTTANLVRSLKNDMDDPEEEISQILIRAASPDLYAVQVYRRGDDVPDSFFVRLSEPRSNNPLEPSVNHQPPEEG